MYLPAHFAEAHLVRLHEFIERHSFGMLVSQVDGLPFASHVPFLLDRGRGQHGTLTCHVARANPHWRQAGGQSALAIFAGPHAYISPAWYEAEQVVPTWNYTAVHACGTMQVVEEPADLLAIVQEMVRVYEAPRPQPWTFDPASPFVRKLLAQIVGLRFEIEKIEGKFKLNQNHPAERREKVIRALQEQGGDNASAIAEMMRAMG